MGVDGPMGANGSTAATEGPALDGHPLQFIYGSHSNVVSQTLWKQEPALLLLIRLFVISFQTESIEMLKEVWQDDDTILLDPTEALFVAIGNRSVGCCATLCSCCSLVGRFKQSEQQLQQRGGPTGNYKGKGSLLGGTLLVTTVNETSAVLWEHREDKLGDKCDPEEVLEVATQLLVPTAQYKLETHE